MARDPQPDDAPGRAARPGDLAARPPGALVARPDPARRGAATSGSSRSRSGPATRSASSRRRPAVGQGITLVVYPRVEPLPLWRLPPASIEGAHASPERTLQTTPLATTVRPYAPGRPHEPDPLAHDRQTARSRSRSSTSSRPPTPGSSSTSSAACEAGAGDESTIEVAVRAAASIADKALGENRAVGLTVNGHRLDGPARGPRRPPAAQDPAAPRRGRGGRPHAARRDAARRASAGCGAA